MTWLVDHHLLKLHFQFLLVSGPLTVHLRGIPPQFVVLSLHCLRMIERMVKIHGGLLVAIVAKVVICLIGIIPIEIENEGGRETETEAMEGIGIEIGTGIETGGMTTMIEGPGKQVEETTTENQALAEVEAGVEAEAEAEAEVCGRNINLVQREKKQKIEHQLPAT